MLRKVVGVFLFAAFFLAACTSSPRVPTLATEIPATPTALRTSAPQPTMASIVVSQLTLLKAEPSPAAALPLRPTLTFTFSAPVEKASLSRGWRFVDAAGKPVRGKIKWLSPLAFSFTPAAPLQPDGATYRAEFTTALRSEDGGSLAAPVTLIYKTADALRVTAVYPADGSEDVPLNGDITLVFSKPMVPLAARESNSAPPLPLRIIPSVKGTGRWVSSAIYVFHPDNALRSNADYTVALPAGVKDLEGIPLRNGIVWRFHTQKISVKRIDIKGSNLLYERFVDGIPLKAPITILFSSPMEPASTEKAVSVVALSGGAVPSFSFEWSRDHTLLTLKPLGFYSLSTTYAVRVAATARAADGGFLSAPVEARFRTVGRPWVKKTPGPQPTYSPWVSVEFTTFMDKASFTDHVVIEPALSRGLSISVYGRYVELGVFDPATTYTITFLPGIADVYGNKTSAPITFTFTTGDLSPLGEAMLPSQVSVLHFDQPKTFYYRYANLDQVSFAIYPLSDAALMDNLLHWNSCHPNGAAIGSWQKDLRPFKDNKFHYLQVDLDKIAGRPLQPGTYCLGVSRKPSAWSGEHWRYFQIVIATENLTLKTSPGNALVWATGLMDGAPVQGLKVNFFGAKEDKAKGAPILAFDGTATTNADGVAMLNGYASPPRFAVVNSNGHFAIVDASWADENSSANVSFWQIADKPPRSTVAFLYTDRPLYRPGQQVFFKGILRVDNDLHYSLPRDTQVAVLLYHEAKLLARQTVAVSDLGTFYGSVLLADDAPVGNYRLVVRPANAADADKVVYGERSLRVANYHKPVFAVTMKANRTDLPPGTQSAISLRATYYAGDAVTNAAVNWRASAYPFYFSPPPRYADFTFSGDETVPPWLYTWNSEHQFTINFPPQNGKGKTDAQGKFDFTVRAPAELKDRDGQIVVWATVTDRGGNSADGHITLFSRISNVYVGIKTDSWLGVVNKPITLHVVALTPQGAPIPNHSVHLQVAEEKWHSVQRVDASGYLRWETTLETKMVADLGEIVTGKDGLAVAQFTPSHSGTFRIIATSADEAGRVRKALRRIWVIGEQEALLWGENGTNQLPLIADRSSYRPGDVAHVVVPRAFSKPVYGLMTVERGKIYSYRLLRLDAANLSLDLPIKDQMAPVIYLSVVEASGGDAKSPPDYRLGVLRLPVALDRQRLLVSATPEKKTAAPGETVRFKIRTTTYDGRPVSAEVSLALVDKALLALAQDDYRLLDAMYRERGLQVATSLEIERDALIYNLKAQRLLPTGPGMGGGGKGADRGGVITVRETFRDTAYWKANVRTDSNGEATVSVTLPDNMTTWVMRARAITADNRVGSAVSELQVSLPFFVRLHAPAFFTAGDSVVLSAVLHNSTAQPLQANVVLKEAKGLQVLSPVSQKATIPPKGQKVVSWRVQVPVRSRRVDLLVQASAGKYHDSSRPVLTLLPGGGIPVFGFTTREAVGSGGALFRAGRVREFVQPSADAVDYSLKLRLASSLLAGLQPKPGRDSGVMESVPSKSFALMRAVALLRMKDVRHLQDAEVQRLKRSAEASLQALLRYQLPSGMWGWDSDSSLGAVMPTAYALDALAAARSIGLAVDARVLKSGGDALRLALLRKRRHLGLDQQAYVVDVLAKVGQSPSTAAYSIAKAANSENLSVGGLALLLRAAETMRMGDDFVHPLLNRLENRVSISAGGAHWDGGWASPWSDALTSTALAVDALLRVDPHATFMERAVRWLVLRYNSTHYVSPLSDAIVLGTLSDWAEFAHEAKADYSYAVFLGGKPQAKGQMQPAKSRVDFQWGAKFLPAGNLTTLDIQRGAGAGALYYTAYLEMRLPADKVRARNDGFAIQRAYYAITDLEHPTQKVHVGGLVQVRLTITVPHDAANVAVVDYLPAGLEGLSQLPVAFIPAEQGFSLDDFTRYGWGCWYFGHRRTYYDHVAFQAPRLPAGTYTLVYYARAAFPGEFVVRPALVWETFFPDVRGRTAGTKFTVTRSD